MHIIYIDPRVRIWEFYDDISWVKNGQINKKVTDKNLSIPNDGKIVIRSRCKPKGELIIIIVINYFEHYLNLIIIRYFCYTMYIIY